MMDDEQRPDEKPLVPRTAAGAAIIGVPVAAVLSLLGWGGQRLLDLDESLVRVQKELDNRGGRFEQSLIDNAKQFERLVIIETKQSIYKEEIDRLRVKIENLQQGELQYLEDRLNLMEEAKKP